MLPGDTVSLTLFVCLCNLSHCPSHFPAEKVKLVIDRQTQNEFIFNLLLLFLQFIIKSTNCFYLSVVNRAFIIS